MPDNETFGQRLRRLRLNQNLTLNQFAKNSSAVGKRGTPTPCRRHQELSRRAECERRGTIERSTRARRLGASNQNRN